MTPVCRLTAEEREDALVCFQGLEEEVAGCL